MAAATNAAICFTVSQRIHVQFVIQRSHCCCFCIFQYPTKTQRVRASVARFDVSCFSRRTDEVLRPAPTFSNSAPLSSLTTTSKLQRPSNQATMPSPSSVEEHQDHCSQCNQVAPLLACDDDVDAPRDKNGAKPRCVTVDILVISFYCVEMLIC